MFSTILKVFCQFLISSLLLNQKILNYMEDDSELDPNLQSLKMDLSDLIEKLNIFFRTKDERAKLRMKIQIVEEAESLIVRFTQKKTEKSTSYWLDWINTVIEWLLAIIKAFIENYLCLSEKSELQT